MDEARPLTVILAVFAEPHEASPTDWEREAEILRVALSPYPFQYRLEVVHRCTPDELHRSLLRLRPSILHVQGHGTQAGLVLVDRLGDKHLVEWAILAQTLADAPWLHTVVLNACDSYAHTQIGSQHFDLITTDGMLSTEVSQAFTAGFYEALTAQVGVSGSYSAGCNRVRLSGIAITALPTLTPAKVVMPASFLSVPLESNRSVLRSIPQVSSAQSGINDSVASFHLRICLIAEMDVIDERSITLSVIDHLRYDALLKGRVTIEVSTLDESRIQGHLLFSTFDIVIVLLWSHLHTLLAASQDNHTELNADTLELTGPLVDLVQAARDQRGAVIMIYRRTKKVLLDDELPDFEERRAHKQRVRGFFEHLDRLQSDSPAYNTYVTPDELRMQLETHLKQVILVYPKHRSVSPQGSTPAKPAPLTPWKGSPFPGLRALTPNDAPIFFGRGRETDELLRRVAEYRVVVVVGASGSGKSSLVGAGLIPRLAVGAIPGVAAWVLPSYRQQTGQWEGIRLSPGELGPNPFMGLALKLAPLLGLEARQIASDLAHVPETLMSYAVQVLTPHPLGSELLVFIDQFEELFTLVDPAYVPTFITMLATIARSSNLRAVLTMRSDFYYRCLEIPALAQLLESGHFPLASPVDTLLEMITRPAERAGLRFEEGLPGRILRDTQQEPGALPLLAYALDELYEACKATQLLSHASYNELGGVQGAIGLRAEDVFAHELNSDAQAMFSVVFRELVTVDELGQVTRRRAVLSHVASSPPTERFVDVFTNARLFVQSAGISGEPIIEVAHEALFRSWSRLNAWSVLIQDDLRLLQKVVTSASEWHEHAEDEAYLWPHERLKPVYEMIARLQPELDERSRRFVHPEYERLFVIFNDPQTEEHRRQTTGDRLVAIGDVTIPGLLRSLEAGGASVRAAAAVVLARFGPKAIPGLAQVALAAQEPDVRLGALTTLRVIGGEQTIPTLLSALRDADNRVRSIAAGALRTLNADTAIDELTAALVDPNVDVRWEAVGVLGAFGDRAVPGLMAQYIQAEPGLRRQILNAVVANGDRVIPTLVGLLAESDSSVEFAAAEALVRLGASATSHVVSVLSSPNAGVRALAVEILEAIGNIQAVPNLTAVLEDSERELRLLAVSALGTIGDASAIPGLRAALYGDDTEMSRRAAEALASIGKPAIPELLAAIKASDRAPVPAIAARALGTMSDLSVEGLTAIVEGVDPIARIFATQALALRGSSAVPVLVASAHALDEEALVVVSAAISEIGESAIAPLLTEMRSSEQDTRLVATMALARLQGAGTAATLVEALTDQDERIRKAAARGLGAMGAEAVPPLLEALHAADENTQDAAVMALVLIGGLAVPGLIAQLESGQPKLQERVARALRTIATPLALFRLAEREHE